MARLTFDQAATAEIQEAAAYYEREREGLGRSFVQAVQAGATKIGRCPLLGRKLRGPFRRYLVPKFPYGIIYALDADEIYVVAVMHLRRKPDYWSARLRRP